MTSRVLPGAVSRTARLGALLLATAGLTASAGAASPDDDFARRQARVAELRSLSAAQDLQHQQTYGDDPAYLVREGLLADRIRRTVSFRGYATGLSGNDPVEFFVIGPASGKAYEALAVSFAKPSDVRAALEFIGVPPGRGVNYLKNRFFPRGERVKMTFRWESIEADGTRSPLSARAEQLLLLRDADGTVTDRTLPLTGLVFTGGVMLPAAEPGGVPRFFADEGDPGSIASNYNEPTTVLDLPAFARQSEVYRSRIVNPAFALTFGTPVEILLEPMRGPDDPPRVIDLTAATSGGPDLPSIRWTLTDPESGQPRASAVPAEGLLAELAKLIDSGREPFITILPHADLPLGTVRQLYALLGGLQTDTGLRIEPPAEGSGHLFFEAFLPDERLRSPENRIWQPIELRLAADGTAILREYTERQLTAPGEPRFRFTDSPVPSPDALRDLLARRVEQRRPLAIFAPATLAYGRLQHWTQPALTPDWVIWIYLEPQ